MRKGSKVTIWMSDKEKRELEAKKTRTLREHLLSDVGIEVNPRLRGRPQSDATKDVMRLYDKFAEDNRAKVKAELLRANRRGLSKDIIERMKGQDEWVFRDEICKNCGFEYRTAFERESHCPRCGVVNKVVVPPHESSLGEPTFLNQPLTETEVEEGGSNLSTGYEPYRDPASNFELMQGGVADRAVVSWDMSRFKFGKTKDDLVEEDE